MIAIQLDCGFWDISGQESSTEFANSCCRRSFFVSVQQARHTGLYARVQIRCISRSCWNFLLWPNGNSDHFGRDRQKISCNQVGHATAVAIAAAVATAVAIATPVATPPAVASKQKQAKASESKRKQANARQRKQTQATASESPRKTAKASKRKQTQANASKRKQKLAKASKS